MKLTLLDFFVILLYIAAIITIGFIAKKKAASSKNQYLLGGNTLPWYMLGLSNASGMFDISGTMWLVTITFIYGLKSIWIPWLWPVFNQIFLMMFMSVWLRRSGATTGAEWIGTRFGNGKPGLMSHGVVVIYAIIGCFGFLAYGFIGLGKFLMIFIPWPIIANFFGFSPEIISPEYIPHVYGVVFTLLATFYAILGGMTSIVWADVMQYSIMTLAGIVIAVIAMLKLSAVGVLNVPDGWLNPFFGWQLNLDWSGIINEVNGVIATDGFSMFGAFFMMMVFKGILVSAAGPAPNYDMQKILAAKSPADAAKMSGSVSVFLLPFRYLMIGGFVVLGLLYYDKLNLMVGNKIDFEQILPAAINEFVPTGLLGLLLVGLIAAFMSTFAGTLNAAQAYMVNDLYLKFVKPDASQKNITTVSYTVGIITVLISIVLGLYMENVDSILKWIVSALYGSYTAANVLKWYWWRFNGQGYFWGMVSGLIPAMVLPLFVADGDMLYYFPVLLVISSIGAIAGSLLTHPTDEHTLKAFYKNVRPWGFWKPIHELVIAEDASFQKNKNFGLDMFNVGIGIVWQTALVVLPIYLVTFQHIGWILSIVIIIITSVILKKTWWNKLG